MLQAKIGRKTFRVKDCKFSSAIGLMFDEMKDKDGALIYGNAIWMPFVRHDLSLVFLDKKMRVTSVANAVPLTLDAGTWKIYRDNNAKYCLELKHRIKLQKGSVVRFLKH